MSKQPVLSKARSNLAPQTTVKKSAPKPISQPNAPSTVKKLGSPPRNIQCTPKLATTNKAVSKINKTKSDIQPIQYGQSTMKPKVKTTLTQSSSTIAVPSFNPNTVRSYSEIVKSEESLLAQVQGFNDTLKEYELSIASKDVVVKESQAKLEEAAQREEKMIAEYQKKLDRLQQSNNERMEEVSKSNKELEAKLKQYGSMLESSGWDPISGQRVYSSDDEQRAADLKSKLSQQILNMNTKAKEQRAAFAKLEQEWSTLDNELLELESDLEVMDLLVDHRSLTRSITIERKPVVQPTNTQVLVVEKAAPKILDLSLGDISLDGLEDSVDDMYDSVLEEELFEECNKENL